MFPAGYVIAAIAVMLTFGAAGDKEGGGAGDLDFTVTVSGSATTVPEPARRYYSASASSAHVAGGRSSRASRPRTSRKLCQEGRHYRLSGPKVVAERLAAHLEASGFVIMRKPIPMGRR